MERQNTENSQHNTEKKNDVGGISLSDFKTPYTHRVMKTGWYW